MAEKTYPEEYTEPRTAEDHGRASQPSDEQYGAPGHV
jgi:hypothetical protein